MPALSSSYSGGGDSIQGTGEWFSNGGGAPITRLPWWLPIGIPLVPILPSGGWGPFAPGSMAADLKISDAEYLSCEQYVVAYVEHLQEAGRLYAQILQKVRGYAISDGEFGIVSALEAKAAQMLGLMLLVGQIRSSIDGKARAFIERIDQLDDFVYGED